MHGVTGRMGTTQHLTRSICAIRADGGVVMADGQRVIPEPVLVGRNGDKLAALAQACDISSWTTDIDTVLKDPEVKIFFDSGSTLMRPQLLRKAIEAGKDVYCEKPVSMSSREALDLGRLAADRGVKNGVVQDKLWLPGIIKLKRIIDSGYFGEILSIKFDFGYWVFPGDIAPSQRPSWNYRAEDGGGIITDMMPHWYYIIENLFGLPVQISCMGATHLKKRWDENGTGYDATADDACYALVRLAQGQIVQISSSWCTRVRRDDLVTIQVDGVLGSAVAGLSDVKLQSATATPRPIWNPDKANVHDFYADWLSATPLEEDVNAFRVQWEKFITHVVDDTPFPWNFMSGAKGIKFAEAAIKSWKSGRNVDVK